MKAKIFLLFLIIILSNNLFAQDIHFSQFFSSPLSLSPALTGHFDADWRVTNNYRSQWKSISNPYKTISIGYDRNFYYYNEKISGGIYIINDQSGSMNFTVNKIFISGAYHKTIGNNTFHLGIQPGFVLKSYDKDKITLPDQFDMTVGTFNSDLPDNESSLNNNISYFDMNIGGAWNRNFGKFEPTVAVSFFHITAPKEEFANKSNRLPLRTAIYGKLNYKLTEKISLIPNLIYLRHKVADEFLLGTNIDYKINIEAYKLNSIYVGFYFRDGITSNFDAIYPVVGAKFKNLQVGISYDFNVSPLKIATSYKGAFEISLIYKSASSLLPKITIPCDRF